jgi:hypothetical protein
MIHVKKIKEFIIGFLSNIGVFVLKGIALFLAFSLFFTILHYVGILNFDKYISPIVMSVSYEIRIAIIVSIGAISHYTFWKTYT